MAAKSRTQASIINEQCYRNEVTVTGTHATTMKKLARIVVLKCRLELAITLENDAVYVHIVSSGRPFVVCLIITYFGVTYG